MLFSLSHIARRTITLVLYGIVVGVLLFFALTRTQVGRDTLRDQLERRFNSTFAGHLEIGELRGNLLNDLFARQVHLYDADGGPVLTVDSVVMRPRWRDVFRQQLTTGRLTLFRPHLELVRQEGGTWNIGEALRKVGIDSSGGGAPWSFTSADIRIIDGTLTTRNRGALPDAVAAGQVFNYTDTDLRDVQARATVEWYRDLKLVELLSFSAHAAEPDLDVQAVQGQLVLEDERLSLNEVFLAVGASRLDLSAWVDPVSALTPEEIARAELAVDLRPSRLVGRELRRLFPVLPLGDTLALAARVQGPATALVVEDLLLERGQTRLRGEGTLLGLPDRLDFDMAFLDNTVDARDLFAVLPDAELPDFRHLDRLTLSLTSEGTWPLPPSASVEPLQVAARMAVSGAAGTLRGTVDLTQRPGEALTYAADLHADTLNLGHLLQDARLQSRLNGRLELNGHGLSFDDLDAAAHLHLSPSAFARRAVDTLRVSATAADRRVEGTIFLGHRGGVLLANTSVDLTADRPAYYADVATQRLNLGPLLLQEALRTDLNTRLTLRGSGTAGPALQGEVDLVFDSSAVYFAEAGRLIPPHRSHLAIARQGSAQPRLSLTGDLADVHLEGDVFFEPLLALSRLWGTALAEAVQREVHKPLARAAADTLPEAAPPVPAVAAWEQGRLREAARASLRAVDIDAAQVSATLHLKRSDLLSALFPALPPLATDLRARLHLAAGADSLHLTGSLHSDSLQTGALHADQVTVHLESTAQLDAPLAETLDLVLDAQAETLHVASQTFQAPSLSAVYRHRGGQLAFSTRPHGHLAALRLAATLDLLDDRNRLTLSDLYLEAGGAVWRNPEDEPVDFYADAAVVHGLTLESQAPGTEVVQRLRVHGTFSSARADTLVADAQNIALRQLSEVAKLKRPLGGLLNGRLALTGGFRQPELTGAVDVATLTFDNRLLGHLTVTSRYMPGSPDIALDAALRPAASDAPALPQGTASFIPEENRLRVSGLFRLPQYDEQNRRLRPSTLALDADVERADLFFFEYLFPELVTNVEGYLTGRGHIGGTLSKPLFNASLQVVEGRFNIPAFNLSYEAAGPVDVDSEGIKLRQAVLRDRHGGTATLAGGLLFNDYRFFSFDLHGVLDDLQIMNVRSSNELAFYGQIWASGTAALTGPLHQALLRSTDIVTHARSETFIPITSSDVTIDPGFIVFADSTGRIPDLSTLTRRRSLLSQRPVGERTFLDGLEMDLNLFAPSGSTVRLVIDPLLGDVINAIGSGRIQLQRAEGEFFTYGTLNVEGGDYLFTAGDVFFRRFLIDAGTITWDGDPTDALLDITASYRTRASRAGLPEGAGTGLIPVIVELHITGRVSTPSVDLSLAIDRRDRDLVSNYEVLEARLNQPDRSTEYATSVLLTNSFLLTTELANAAGDQAEGARANTRNQLAFTSVSQLVSSQLNRYLSRALPNVDLNLGLQGERAQDLDVTYGVALRLLDERLIIRGQGIYQNDSERGLEARNLGEFVVEVRLSPSVSVEVFWRREGDVLSDQTLMDTAGAGLSYQTQFSSWDRLFHRLFGWIRPEKDTTTPPEPVAGNTEE